MEKVADVQNIAVVTGGAGFIGSHLTDALLEKDWRVRVLDDLSSGSLDNLPTGQPGFEFVEGDIRNLETCKRVLQGARWVFHQAALGSVPRSLKVPAASLEVQCWRHDQCLYGCSRRGGRASDIRLFFKCLR